MCESCAPAKVLKLSVLLQLMVSFSVAAQSSTVMLLGDSWADQQWSDQVHAAVFVAHGFDQVVVLGEETTISGSTAADWNEISRLQLISDQIASNPETEVVQVTLGGNDFLDLWRADMLSGEVASLQQQIAADLTVVIEHILLQDPDIEVLLSFYDYPNFVDTLSGISGIFCSPLWNAMSQPTPRELNEAAVAFEAVYRALSVGRPRVSQVSHFGLMQNAYGFPDLGIAPGEIALPGNLDLPSPMEAMRLGYDCFHLRPAGYQILVENLFTNYYVGRFDRLFRSGFEGPAPL